MTDKTVAAIVPAFNEAARIADVLSVLNKSTDLDEIIVVDDGSHDGTADIARGFDKVTVYSNGQNKGKAYSMDRGVKESESEYIFFCDADLVGLTPEMIHELIRPVVTGQTDMAIGVRGNPMQKIVHLFAINSGERVLQKSLWENLPEFFKYRFRIEAGLNYYAPKYGKGYIWKAFNHSQTLKEKKYGFWAGTIQRWRMNWDVGVAYIAAILDSLGVIRLRR